MVAITRYDRSGNIVGDSFRLADYYYDESLPSYTAPEYREILPLLNVSRDVYKGATAWIKDGQVTNFDRAVRFLPQEQQEPDDAYVDRLKRSLFVNFYAPAIQGFAGLLSKFQVLPESPRSLQDNIKNVNLQGANLRAYLQTLDILAMRDGWVAVLVEYPRSLPIPDRLTERQVGLRPYFTAIERKDILNWSLSYRPDGSLQLDTVTIRRNITRTKGVYGRETVEQFWVMSPGMYEIWEAVEDNNKTEVVKVETVEVRAGSGQPLTYIPWVFYPIDDIDPFEVTPPLFDLAEMNIIYFQRFSDYSEILRKCNLPVPVREGYLQPGNMGEKMPPLIYGPNSVIDVPIGGSFKFAEPTGVAIASTREALQDLESQMLRRSLSFFSSAPGNMTEDEVQLRSTQTRANVSQLASDKESAVEQMFAYWAEWTGEDAAGGIAVDKTLLSLPLAPQALQVFSQMETLGQLDRMSFLQILQEGRAFPEGVDVLELMRRGNRENQSQRRAATEDGRDEDSEDSEDR